MIIAELELADWRRRVAELYAAVRADADPERAHARWRQERDELIGKHPQSPVPPGDIIRSTGIPYWPYDPRLRFELPLLAAAADATLALPTDGDRMTALRLIGRVEIPEPVNAEPGGLGAAAVRRGAVRAAARRHRGREQLWRRPVPAGHGQGR